MEMGTMEQNTEKEIELAELWHEFNFKTEPPRPGSTAESRLLEKVSEYAHLDHFGMHEDNTGKADKRDILFDELAVMAFGGNELEPDQIEALKNFIEKVKPIKIAEKKESALAA